MSRQTHGRWPWVAAASAAPLAVLSLRRPALRPLAALTLHQTEEWVWPGGFLPWINRVVMDSGEDEFPIDRRLGLLINVGFGWGLSAVSMLGPRAAGPTTGLYVSHLGNAGLHLSWAVRHRAYDPGTVTAALTLVPVSVAGLRGLWQDPDVSRRAVIGGAVAGVVGSIALMPALRARKRR